eukprot:symbB.v1.2.001070.t1/scaffold33.1/size517934/22
MSRKVSPLSARPGKVVFVGFAEFEMDGRAFTGGEMDRMMMISASQKYPCSRPATFDEYAERCILGLPERNTCGRDVVFVGPGATGCELFHTNTLGIQKAVVSPHDMFDGTWGNASLYGRKCILCVYPVQRLKKQQSLMQFGLARRTIGKSGRLRRAGSLASLTDQTQWTTSNFGASTNQALHLPRFGKCTVCTEGPLRSTFNTKVITENNLRGVQREVGAMSDNNKNSSSKSDSSRGSSKEQEEEVEDREDNESGELTTQEQADRAQIMEEAWEISGLSDLKTMDDSTLGSVTFPQDVVQDVQAMWNLMLEEWGSREMAGENFFTVLFDAAPSLQIMFKSPKAVTAMRFMAGLGDTIAMLGKPAYLRKEVEAMAFRHLEVDVSLVRADFFRESMLEMLDERFGAAFTINARIGFHALINYCGGAFVYVRREYAGRIRTITNSWNVVQKSEVLAAAVEVEEGEVDEAGEAKEEEQDDMSPKTEAMSPESAGMDSVDMIPAGKEMKVPTTFNEMLLFNASVMGYGSSTWMNIVLQQFDDMVKNVANFGRLQEECDVMSLVLAKYKGRINLPEFKAVTLASLRSLLPAEWDSEHEVAWGWLWENIEGLLSAMLGKPKQQEDALERCFSRMSEADFSLLRSKLFPVFLETNPAAQSYVTQSATRINFVAEKILGLTLELYRAPRRLVEEISAVGLRHVGYGIPTEVFPHFVSSSVEILQTVTQVELVIEAFRWSLALLSKIMMRTISEGSTLVMKAINANQKFQLKKAMEVCARGQRAKELLNITAGTQSISPFYWAIDSGALVCAQAILEDLLTIRADRDVYYYGVDALFTCHPECIQKLCARAPTLMSTLLNGLVWHRIGYAAMARVFHV